VLEPIWAMRDSRSRQFTTFDPVSGEKFRRIAPGARATIAEAEGPGVIGRAWFTFPGWFWQHWDPMHPVDPTILRLLILRIYWDGSPFPSVQAPLGDFFGVGHCEYRHWTSRFLGMSSGGFYCYFPMPFASVRIEVENLHASMDALLFANISWEQVPALDPSAGRFHASWQQAENPGPAPIEILQAEGRGHFAGCTVSLQGKDPNYLAFLEAPEYIWIDAEEDSDPTIVGTGLEDYFNGGWYFRDQEFSAPLHGVPLKDPLRSMVSMYRFHEHDAVAFQERIRFEFRNPWKPERLRPFRSSATAYWYQDRAARLAARLPAAEEMTRLYRIRDVDHQSVP
jgi:hypothetical protein